MAPDPVDLIVPAALDQAAAVALLEERLTLSPGRASLNDLVLLDSF